MFAAVQASALTIYVHYPDDVTAQGRHLYVWDGSGNVLNGAYPGNTISESEVLSGKTWYKFETNADVVGVIVNDNYLNRTGDIAGITKDRFIDITGNTGGQISGTNEWSQVNGILLDAKLFPDANFRAAVAAKVGVAEGEIIPYSSKVWPQNNWMSGFQSKHITSIKGIEYFPQISMLDISGNDFTTLDTGDINILSTLYCNNNTQPLTLDVSRNAGLKILDCYTSKLASLDVTHNSILEWLNCDDNKLTEIDVTHNPKLNYLSINKNQLTELDVTHNPELTMLAFHSNKVANTVDVSQNTKLQTLSFYNNHTITSIDLHANVVLENLYSFGNKLSALDVSHNTKLKLISTGDNLIPELDVTMLPNLEKLYCFTNKLTELDVTHNPKLNLLSCGTNNINELDLSQCPLLKELYCFSNNLYTLDVSNNPLLEMISCNNNHLIQFDATGKTMKSSGFIGNGQTRTMKATIEMVNGELKYVVTMPNGTPVPNGLGGIETFVNNDVMYVQQVVSGAERCVKGDDGLTRFYIPLTKPKTFQYSYRVNSEGLQSPLVATITVIYPDPAFKLDGNYRSTFQPAEVQNSYKNTITIIPVFDQSVNSFDGATYTVTRKAGNSDTKETVATVALSLVDGVYHYNVTYPQGSWATNVDQDGRWDKEAVVTSGIVTDDIKIVDYFEASTAEGGDKAETYTYALKEDLLANKIVVPVYAATTTGKLASGLNKEGYTLEEITNDVNHSLAPSCGATVTNTKFNESGVSHTIYCNGEVVADGISRQSSYYHDFGTDSDDSGVRFSSALNYTIAGGDVNTYGTNEISIPVAHVDVISHDLVKSIYKFHRGRSRYFTCLLDIMMSMDEQMYTSENGGYRVWRSCGTSDEELDFLSVRSNDFMFYSQMNLADGDTGTDDVGDEEMSMTGEDGQQTIEFMSGLFGAFDTHPIADYRVRAYYKAQDSDTYYVVDKIFSVVWGDEGVVTGIHDIAAVNNVASVRYYNLAGHSSTVPFSGVNIVVTTFTDGSKTTQKVIK